MKFIRLLLGVLFITGFAGVSFADDFLNILEPKNGVALDNKNISFKWCPISVTGNYQLQISTDPLFGSVIYDTTTANTFLVRTIAVKGSIYWRVRIIGTNFRSGWTDPVSFKLIDPVTAGNILIWYSAQNGTPAIGSPVSTWPDQSGNANDALQPTAGNQPVVQNGGPLLNNNKVVRFDGADDFMAFNLISTVRAMFFMVKSSEASSSGYRCIMGDDFPRFDFHGSDGNLLFFNGAASNFIMNGQGYVNKVSTSPTSVKKPTAYSVLSFITTNNVNTSRISRDRVADRVWFGDYGDILMYSDTLNPQTRDDLETYIMNRYVRPVAVRDTVIGNNFCTNVTLTAPNTYTNYLWSTGSTAPSISVPPNKKYFVSTKDIFGIQSTTYFNAFPYKRLNNAKIYICKGDTFKIDLKTPAGFTALWNTGANTTQLSIYQTGQYTVKITDAGGKVIFNQAIFFLNLAIII